MAHTLSLEMLDDGAVIVQLVSGAITLRASVPSITALEGSPLFQQFRGLDALDSTASLSAMEQTRAAMLQTRAQGK